MRKLMIFVAASIVLISMAFSVSATPNRPVSVMGSYASLNWGGYAINSTNYHSVSGSWIVPKLNTSVSGYSSAWVGIGGFNGNSVIQIGTEQDCLSGSTTAGEMRFHGVNINAVPGMSIANPGKGNHGGGNSGHGGKTSSCTPTYSLWWEMYPDQSYSITNVTVSPGDKITASVSENSDGSWTLKITDNRTGTFATTQTPDFGFGPDTTSAEAIIERPALCTVNHCKITNLADFGNIQFSDVLADGSSFGSDANAITMVDNGLTPLIRLNPLNNNAFSADWLANK